MAYGKLLLSILFLLGFSVQGCSLNKMAVGTVGDIMSRGEPVFEEEGDLEIAKSALPANLKLIEVLYREDPRNGKLGLLLAKSWFAYSFAFVEEEYWATKYTDYPKALQFKERAGRFYLKGKNHALAQLLDNNENEASRKQFAASVQGDLKVFGESLKGFGKNDVPALFWLGFNWGEYINLNMDSMEALADIARVKLIMERVLELDETYWFGSAHLFLGSYYSSRPETLGGNQEEGRKHFERAIEVSGGKFLMAKALYARYYATQFQDMPLYDRLLQEIAAAPESVLPGQEFITAVSKKLAARLVTQKEEFFDLE